ncbi:MAG: sigma-54-dependent Fis family transcriptional regulator [Deltaproteobacteria bacterium]|nr:sigma-54-dependent Fis family transcriptional regulator [Deltaproteobacteria bacterium]
MASTKSKRRKILIVEDDVSQLNRYLEMATRIGLDADGADSLEKALAYLDNVNYQFVLTDMHLQSGRQNSYEGLELLKEVKTNHPETVPLAMSADPKIETYRRVQAEGVAHFFRKPILGEEELQIHIEAAMRLRRSSVAGGRKRSVPEMPSHLIEKYPDGLVISSDIRTRARKAAVSSTIPVIITGETGTGKEEVAKLVHRLRTEIDGTIPFVPVNCANLTGDTAVSMLFGHKKGAFTGAEETTVGYVGEANGGILFLDEIHALSEDCQKRLLRVLNDGTYNRTGESKTLHSEFQVIVASTKDLDDEVEAGRFLLDLRGRLTGLQIALKPLRERADDLLDLIDLGFARLGAKVSRNTVNALVDRCGRYYWQGNIRQLMQVLNIMVTEAVGDERAVSVDDLPELKTMLAPGPKSSDNAGQAQFANITADGLYEVLAHALTTDVSLWNVVAAVERAVVEAAQKRHGSIRRTAEALGVTRLKLSQVLGDRVES